jgi:hypothetical protein
MPPAMTLYVSGQENHMLSKDPKRSETRVGTGRKQVVCKLVGWLVDPGRDRGARLVQAT